MTRKTPLKRRRSVSFPRNPKIMQNKSKESPKKEIIKETIQEIVKNNEIVKNKTENKGIQKSEAQQIVDEKMKHLPLPLKNIKEETATLLEDLSETINAKKEKLNIENLLIQTGIYNKINRKRKRMTISQIDTQEEKENEADLFYENYAQFVEMHKNDLIEQINFDMSRREEELHDLIEDFNENENPEICKYLKSKEFYASLDKLKDDSMTAANKILEGKKIETFTNLKKQLCGNFQFLCEKNQKDMRKIENLKQKLKFFKKENEIKQKNIENLENKKKEITRIEDFDDGTGQILLKLKKIEKIFKNLKKDEDSSKNKNKENSVNSDTQKYLKEAVFLELEKVHEFIKNKELDIKRSTERNELQKNEFKKVDKFLRDFKIEENIMQEKIKKIKENFKKNKGESFDDFMNLRNKLKLTDGFTNIKIERLLNKEELQIQMGKFFINIFQNRKIHVKLIEHNLNEIERVIYEYIISLFSENSTFESIDLLFKAEFICREINFIQQNLDIEIKTRIEEDSVVLNIKGTNYFLNNGKIYLNKESLCYGSILKNIKENFK